MAPLTETTCPTCHAAVSPNAYFCPNCGKPLQDKPQAVSIARQVIVYAISLFLPPFGLWYAWKYYNQPDELSKKIGVAAAILTIISIAFTVWATFGLIDSVNQSINSINIPNF